MPLKLRFGFLQCYLMQNQQIWLFFQMMGLKQFERRINNCKLWNLGISSITIKERLEAAFDFIDAPVLGGTIGAENAILTFMTSEIKTIEENNSIFSILWAKTIYLERLEKDKLQDL